MSIELARKLLSGDPSPKLRGMRMGNPTSYMGNEFESDSFVGAIMKETEFNTKEKLKELFEKSRSSTESLCDAIVDVDTTFQYIALLHTVKELLDPFMDIVDDHSVSRHQFIDREIEVSQRDRATVLEVVGGWLIN